MTDRAPRTGSFIVVAMTALSCAAHAQPAGMVLTFAEEFDAPLSLDTGKAGTAGNKWKTSDGWGNRTLAPNGELQLYMDADYKGLGIDPFTVKDGILTISARPATPAVEKAIGYRYTSGELTTAKSFAQQYGYFEMRAQLPTERGLWPAFWLLATDGKWPPEIDVVENVGKEPTLVHNAVHTRAGRNAAKATYMAEDIGNDFHIYGMRWTKDTIAFYFDGRETFSTRTPDDAHKPMYLLVNLAVGGKWPGSPDSSTNWAAADMKIDYIRVYADAPDQRKPK